MLVEACVVQRFWGCTLISFLFALQLGIGNTTAAAAVLSALLQLDPERVCGRGTGVDDSGLLKKQQAVTDALEINADLVASGPKGILQAVGACTP